MQQLAYAATCLHRIYADVIMKQIRCRQKGPFLSKAQAHYSRSTSYLGPIIGRE